MMYEFKNVETGELAEFDYPILRAPGIGSVVTRGGVNYKRLPSSPSVSVSANVRVVAETIQPNHPDAPRVDSEGRAMFDGQAEVDQFERDSKVRKEKDPSSEWEAYSYDKSAHVPPVSPEQFENRDRRAAKRELVKKLGLK